MASSTTATPPRSAASSPSRHRRLTPAHSTFPWPSSILAPQLVEPHRQHPSQHAQAAPEGVTLLVAPWCQLYLPDNGPVTYDELDIVEAGKNYGWPLTFESRYADCEANQVTEPIYFFAREGMKPLDHLSVVGPRGMAFASSSVYPLLDDSLLVCEEFTQTMRRLVLSGANQDQVTEDDVVVRNCQLDIAVSPDGVIYYGNLSEIRRLAPIS